MNESDTEDNYEIFNIAEVASEEESDALDSSLGLKKIELRVPNYLYDLLGQLADYNEISLPHLIRTIIEQKLKV